MPRLLFFDIDGTLITDDFKIPDSVKPALMKARENDCLIFINTGRTLCNVDPALKGIPIDGYVFGCGTRIIASGKTLRELEYDHETTMKILKIFRKSPVPTVFECDTGLYYDEVLTDDDMIPAFRGFSDARGLTRFTSGDDQEFRAVKMFCKLKPDEKELLLSNLKEGGFPYYAIDRGRGGFEIVPEGCSKADGIDVVRGYYGTDLKDCYVFGDSNNDLSMLRHVPNSIAMGQAPDSVKECCSLVTDTPENDGIAKALKKLGLI